MKKNEKQSTNFGTVNYPVGDFLIQIKNASLARKRKITVRNTKLTKAVALVLKKEGVLGEVNADGQILEVALSFSRKEPVLMGVKLISTPGLRVYKKSSELISKKGYSFFVISTPEGLMTSREAKKKNLGGEVIAEIW